MNACEREGSDLSAVLGTLKSDGRRSDDSALDPRWPNSETEFAAVAPRGAPQREPYTPEPRETARKESEKRKNEIEQERYRDLKDPRSVVIRSVTNDPEGESMWDQLSAGKSQRGNVRANEYCISKRRRMNEKHA
ncbi:hypothetical protein FQA39_LY18943 [Lamprigera yunnana]|nr:hypothetical protein FQA39_LY18943 [Lamprigera yunnana]